LIRFVVSVREPTDSVASTTELPYPIHVESVVLDFLSCVE
jgi:hypothetical protein